jgi:hypothetical protein
MTPRRLSSAEVALVTGLISGLTSMIEETKTFYDAVKDKGGLPGPFRDLAARLTMANDKLEAIKIFVQE